TPTFMPVAFSMFNNWASSRFVVLRCGLNLDKNGVVNDQVGIVFSNDCVLIADRDSSFQFRFEGSSWKLDSKGALVNAVEKAVPEMIVHFKGRSDNCLGNFLVRKVFVSINLKHFLSV